MSRILLNGVQKIALHNTPTPLSRAREWPKLRTYGYTPTHIIFVEESLLYFYLPSREIWI